MAIDIVARALAVSAKINLENGTGKNSVQQKGTTASYDNMATFGKFNKNSPDNIFEIGCGTDTNNRSNAFEALRDGRAKVKSAPIDNDDVVRKQELDTKFDKTNIAQTTGDSTTEVMSQKAVTDAVKETKNNIADLKEALYGYVLDTAEVETESVIPSTVEVGGNTYNLVDNVRGLVKEIKGGTVKSNNLFDINSAVQVSGFSSFSKNENQITVSQSNRGQWSSANVLLDTSIVGKTITVTANAKTDGINKTYIRIQWLASDGLAGGLQIESNFISGNSYQKITASGVVPKQPGEKFNNLCIMFYSNTDATLESGVTYSATFTNIQLELGSTATDYKPYFAGLKSVEYTGLEVKGKNLLDISKYADSYSSNSTYELSDSSIKLNITGKDAYVGVQNDNKIAFEVEPNTTYYFSCDYTNTNNTLSKIIIGIFNSEKVWTNNIFMFSNGLLKGSFTTNDSTYYLSFRFGSNSVENEISTSIFSNIMVVKGSTAPTEYKQYREQTILPFTTTLRGVDTYKDRIIITKNESDDYYTATKISNLISYSFTGDEAGWNFADWDANYKRGYIYLEQYYDNVGICDKYNWSVQNYSGMWIHETATNQLNILQLNDYWTNAGVTDVATFKTYLKSIGGLNVVVALSTPTTEVLSTTLTESDVMPLLEFGGSVEIINENSLYITGSTALEMVYKLINNTTTTSEVTE